MNWSGPEWNVVKCDASVRTRFESCDANGGWRELHFVFEFQQDEGEYCVWKISEQSGSTVSLKEGQYLERRFGGR